MVSAASEPASRPATRGIPADELAARFGPAYKWFATCTVMVGTIAAILSSTMTNVALPDMMGEFGLGQDQIQWVSTAFLAATTASMLAAAWGVAAFGVRRCFMLSLAVFCVGCLVGGYATDASELILARAIQGTAAGVIQPLSMVIIFLVFPPNRRGTAMGLYGLGVILAPALGPTFGGVLIDNYSWRYTFLACLPLSLFGMLPAPIFLPTERRSTPPPFDWLGFVLVATGIGAFLAGLSNGQRLGWDSNFVVGGFVLSGICAVGFLLQEQRTAHPVMDLDVYLNPRFVAASVVAFMLGVGLFSSTYLVPLFVQTVQGYTPTASGLLLAPAGVALGFIQPLGGRLSDRLSARVLIIVGIVFFGVSNWLMTDADTSTPFWRFAMWVAIGRMGMGLIMPALNSGALRVLEPRLVSHGAGAINFVRQLGGAVGVGALSVYLERETTTYASEFNAMQTGGARAAQTLGRIAGALARAGLPDNPHIGARALEAHRFLSQMIAAQASVMGFRESFLLVTVGFFAALVPAYFMRPWRPSQESGRKAATERIGPSPPREAGSTAS
jgi:EmrB/QacA subfamily drug resistance transporter